MLHTNQVDIETCSCMSPYSYRALIVTLWLALVPMPFASAQDPAPEPTPVHDSEELTTEESTTEEVSPKEDMVVEVTSNSDDPTTPAEVNDPATQELTIPETHDQAFSQTMRGLVAVIDGNWKYGIVLLLGVLLYIFRNIRKSKV